MLKLLRRKHSDGRQHPTLIIFFDLGAKDDNGSLTLYQGADTGDEQVFIRHAKGHDASLFECSNTQNIGEDTINDLWRELNVPQWLTEREEQILYENHQGNF